MSRTQKGFTLIELMIVVAIIGILSGLAVPAYQDYTARAKVSEALGWLSGVKVSVADYYIFEGDWPNSLDKIGVPEDAETTYISEVTMAVDGMLVIRFHNVRTGVDGQTIWWKPVVQPSGAIRWECMDNDIEHKYLPSVCRNDATP